MLRGLISQTVWHGPQISNTQYCRTTEAERLGTAVQGQPSIMTVCSTAKRCSLAQWDQWAMWGTVNAIKIKRCYGHSQKDCRQLQLYRNTGVHTDWGNRSGWTCFSCFYRDITVQNTSQQVENSKSVLTLRRFTPALRRIAHTNFYTKTHILRQALQPKANSFVRIIPKKCQCP
jgi:hypothetical protein